MKLTFGNKAKALEPKEVPEPTHETPKSDPGTSLELAGWKRISDQKFNGNGMRLVSYENGAMQVRMGYISRQDPKTGRYGDWVIQDKVEVYLNGALLVRINAPLLDNLISGLQLAQSEVAAQKKGGDE